MKPWTIYLDLDGVLVDFNAIGQYGEVNFSPIPYPRPDDVDFWVKVNLMRLDAETCDCND